MLLESLNFWNLFIAFQGNYFFFEKNTFENIENVWQLFSQFLKSWKNTFGNNF